MLPWFTEEYGNPHSVEHVMGQTAEKPRWRRLGSRLGR